MKLQFATWLLSFAALSVSSVDAAAAGVRGKDDSNSKRRVLQGNQEAKYLIQDIQYEHDESGRRLFGNGNAPEHLDSVELPNGLIYNVDGFVPPGWTMSGQNVFLPPNTVIDDSTATITLPNSAGRLLESGDAEVPKVEKSLTEEQQRNLAELNRQLREGDRSVLAVKVVVSDAAYGYTPSYLECKVFGTSNGADCGDTYHLANAYRACSYDKLRFNKVPDRPSGSSTVTDIVNGVVTVTLNSNVAADGDGVVRNAVTSALNTAFGTTSSSTFANHMMYCLPPGTMSGIAYAYINSQISVYSNNWCNNVSAQLHELGHNINLAHSNEGATTYADQSGMMGYSYGNESSPRMCFNAAKNYQLGWYSDKYAVITPGASTNNCFAGNLHGTAFYGDPSVETVGIKVNTNTATDYYIMFNAKTGIQSGTVEGGNTVMVVTTGAEGTGYSASTLEAKLSPSTTGYSLSLFSNQGLNTVLYVDSKDVANQYATIRIETGGQACVPPAPTPPPTPAPTNPPTLPQPTPAPTPVPPTNPPTPAPTVLCESVASKGECNNYAYCGWSGSPKSGNCYSLNPPPPTPPPTVDPNAPPTTPSPTSNCPACLYSDTGYCCGVCVDSGKPSNRGCF